MKAKDVFDKMILVDNISPKEIAEQMRMCYDIDKTTRDCLDLIDYTVIDFNVLKMVSMGKKLYAFYPAIEKYKPNNYSVVCPIYDGTLFIENWYTLVFNI